LPPLVTCAEIVALAIAGGKATYGYSLHFRQRTDDFRPHGGVFGLVGARVAARQAEGAHGGWFRELGCRWTLHTVAPCTTLPSHPVCRRPALLWSGRGSGRQGGARHCTNDLDALGSDCSACPGRWQAGWEHPHPSHDERAGAGRASFIPEPERPRRRHRLDPGCAALPRALRLCSWARAALAVPSGPETGATTWPGAGRAPGGAVAEPGALKTWRKFGPPGLSATGGS
jgi:hypothetical protein